MPDSRSPYTVRCHRCRALWKQKEKNPSIKAGKSRQIKTAIFMSTLRHQIPGAGAGRSSTPAEAVHQAGGGTGNALLSARGWRQHPAPPGCRIERRIRVHFHQRLNDILPDGFDFTGHFHEVQKGTVTAKVSEAVAFGVCFQEKVTGKHGVYMSTVTADFIRAADFFSIRGVQWKDVLFGKPERDVRGFCRQGCTEPDTSCVDVIL